MSRTAFFFPVLLCAALYAQPAPNLDPAELHVLPVQGSVFMLVGPNSNVTIQTGHDGVFLVDTMSAPLAPRIAAEIKKLTDQPIRYIVDTSVHADHVGGNEPLQKMGATGASPVAGGGATVIAHESVLNRMTQPVTGNQTPPPQTGLPNDTYDTPTKDVYWNGEAVVIFHAPKAVTDGDSIVFFRKSDVLSVGDIFSPQQYPVIDLNRGGSVNGLIDALNFIIHITVPARLQDGGTRVIPGHGRLCGEADVVEYREMVTIIRDRVQDAIKRGLSLAQVKDAKLSLDYDAAYGGREAGDVFVESVYQSLGGK